MSKTKRKKCVKKVTVYEEAYHRSSSPASVCIRASTHTRRLEQSERLSFSRAGRADNVDEQRDEEKAGGAQ